MKIDLTNKTKLTDEIVDYINKNFRNIKIEKMTSTSKKFKDMYVYVIYSGNCSMFADSISIKDVKNTKTMAVFVMNIPTANLIIG